VDIPITDPFVVATGARIIAQNMFVRVTLENGSCGYGEAAPFPEVGGEDRATCMEVATKLASSLLGQSAGGYEQVAATLRRAAPANPAARCGLETALVDAHCRSRGIPQWALWGSADVRERETDITIPICDADKTLALARAWHARGFRQFKMKIGHDVEEDIRRLRLVHQALRDVAFIGDGNQGYSREECLAFAQGVKRFGGNLILLEQPLIRDDLDGLQAIRRLTGVPVAADESVRSLEDARLVLKHAAADFINVKIMKTGLLEAFQIAQFARNAGFGLMVGGMVETRIAMGCSFSLVLGMAGFKILDLDTPLLLAQDPVMGGYRYEGPKLQPWQHAGLDLTVPCPADAIVVR
jgi:L-alanine-DL-glutamate epimerase-like enolase superfamily enzyme